MHTSKLHQQSSTGVWPIMNSTSNVIDMSYFSLPHNLQACLLSYLVASNGSLAIHDDLHMHDDMTMLNESQKIETN